jgi:hypothetical protein
MIDARTRSGERDVHLLHHLAAPSDSFCGSREGCGHLRVCLEVRGDTDAEPPRAIQFASESRRPQEDV